MMLNHIGSIGYWLSIKTSIQVFVSESDSIVRAVHIDYWSIHREIRFKDIWFLTRLRRSLCIDHQIHELIIDPLVGSGEFRFSAEPVTHWSQVSPSGTNWAGGGRGCCCCWSRPIDRFRCRSGRLITDPSCFQFWTCLLQSFNCLSINDSSYWSMFMGNRWSDGREAPNIGSNIVIGRWVKLSPQFHRVKTHKTLHI